MTLHVFDTAVLMFLINMCRPYWDLMSYTSLELFYSSKIQKNLNSENKYGSKGEDKRL